VTDVSGDESARHIGHHFTIAQLPRGTALQQAFYAQLQSIGRILQLTSSALDARRLKDWLRQRGRSLVDFGREQALAHLGRERPGARSAAEAVSEGERKLAAACASGVSVNGNVSGALPMARPCDPSAPIPVALSAFMNVVRNLGWHHQTDKIVFAHTHQPLATVCDSRQEVRLWNTGSWIYEPSHSSPEAYCEYAERAWPGTGVLIDTDAEQPELIEMLADYNPLRSGRRSDLASALSAWPWPDAKPVAVGADQLARA
jgi:hypothetical protein